MARRRPNFVIVLTDDQGYADLGCFAARHIRTPHLDRMAREGMRLTDFYSMPICGPARAALMTGCYPLRLAERENVKQNMPVLHGRELTLAMLLRAEGYATGMFGKWDLAGHGQNPEMGLQMDLLPTHHGFDEYFGTPASNDRWEVTTLIEGDRIVENPVRLDRGTTERFTDCSLDFIDRHREEPFLLTLATNMPHVSLHTSAEFAGYTGLGPYADAIAEIDHHVGRIFARLAEHGLSEDTVVVFFSDNGPWLSKGDHGGCADPLRSGKLSTWEGGPRVPCILWGPGRIPAGRTCRAMVRSLDLLPTFLSLAGAHPPIDRVTDGVDLTHLLCREPDGTHPVDEYAYYFRTHLQALRRGPWKLILKRPVALPWLKGCSPNPHIAPEDDIPIPVPRLYHLPTDIRERNDLAGEHVALVEELLTAADAYRQDIGDYHLVGRGARFFDEGERRPRTGPGGVWIADDSSTRQR